MPISARGASPLLLQRLRRARDVRRLRYRRPSPPSRARSGTRRGSPWAARSLTKRLDGLQHLLGVLPRHQPAGDLHRGLRGDDRLGADALVAAGDAVELQRGARPDLLEHAVALLAGRLAQPDIAEERAIVEAEPCPLLELLGRRLLDAVVEARDAHLAGIVVHLAQDPGQRADRVHGRAAVAARMQVAARSGDDDLGRRRCP